MKVFARVVPTVTGSEAMSVPSGRFKATGQEPDTLKAAPVKVLRWSVRFVRRIFYCLTHAHTREGLFMQVKVCCFYSLGTYKRAGQAGQIKEVSVFI